MRVSRSSQRDALAFRGARLFLGGQTLSFIGTFVQQFAQSWLVLQLTGDKRALPASVALQTLPLLLLGSWAGALADRFDNRRLLLITNSLNAILAFTLAAMVATERATVPVVFVFAAIGGVIGAFDRPASQAMLSELAPHSAVAGLVSLNAMIFPIARLVGPPVASALIGSSSIAMCFFVNAASFVVAAISLLFIKSGDLHPRTKTPRAPGQIKAGFQYAKRDPIVGPGLITMFVVGFAGFNFTMVMPMMAKFTFDASDATLSVVLMLSAVGSLLGGVFSGRLGVPNLRTAGLAAVAFGVTLSAFGLAPNIGTWFGLSFVVGCTATLFTTLVVAILQTSSRPDMIGRVMALYGIAFLGTTPLGAIAVALLSSAVSTRAPFAVGGVVVAGAGAWLLGQTKRSAAVVAIRH